MTRALTKQMRITLVCPGHASRAALVTLTRAVYGAGDRWYAISHVDDDGEAVEHVSHGHADERAALVESAEWLRTTFGATTTCFGGTVSIVGATPARSAA